jgi:hypothetical protein
VGRHPRASYLNTRLKPEQHLQNATVIEDAQTHAPAPLVLLMVHRDDTVNIHTAKSSRHHRPGTARESFDQGRNVGVTLSADQR